MKGRTIRRAASIGCSLVFVLLLLLWMRSYWRMDAVAAKVSKERALFVASQLGRVYIGVDVAVGKTGYMTRAVPAASRGKQPVENRIGFGGGVGERNASFLMVPHWFVLLVVVVLAGCVQLGARFSLRVMLLILPLVVLVVVLLACLHILRGAISR